MSERHEGQEGEAPDAPAGPSAGERLLRALRPGFALEVQQDCARITEDLLALEAPPASAQQTAAHRGRALRLLHGLRGSAATLGAPGVSARAQDLEGRLRSLPTPVPRPAADALLHALEQLVHEAQAWAAGATPAASAAPSGSGEGP